MKIEQFKAEILKRIPKYVIERYGIFYINNSKNNMFFNIFNRKDVCCVITPINNKINIEITSSNVVGNTICENLDSFLLTFLDFLKSHEIDILGKIYSPLIAVNLNEL